MKNTTFHPNFNNKLIYYVSADILHHLLPPINQVLYTVSPEFFGFDIEEVVQPRFKVLFIGKC